MRRVACLGAAVFATAVVFAANDAPPPPWAYGFPSTASATPAPAPAAPAPAPDATPRQIPGSTGSFTLAQIRDGFGPADWFPGDHPAMPEIVAQGRRPDVRACSLCHYPNGKGRPENAGVAGLPVSYFVQTMADF
jgi:cytochrome c553